MSLNKYCDKNIFLAKVKEKKIIFQKNNNRICHIILDISDLDVEFKVGDRIAIFCENDSIIIDKILKFLKVDKNTIVKNKWTKEEVSIYEFLKFEASISHISKQLMLLFFSENEIEEILKENPYISLLELLKIIKKQNIKYDLDKICNNLLKMRPRIYSIANSLLYHKNEIHLIVQFIYLEKEKKIHPGVASHYLFNLINKNSTIKAYINKSYNFDLSNQNDIIMIATGVGIAPFIAFLQEMEKKKNKYNKWLFWGRRFFLPELFFDKYLNELDEKKIINYELVLSRERDNMYVQKRIWMLKEKIFQDLKNNTIIYVCGSRNMGKDVENMIKKIIIQLDGKNEEQANLFFKQLRKEKRYLQDIY